MNYYSFIQKTELIKYNIVIIGASGVGKTTFISNNRFCSQQKTQKPTFVSFDFMNDFYLTISDMPGFDIIQDNWLSHLKKADCVIIMFDVTQLKSFQLVSDFIKSAKTNSKDKAVVIMLIGSKCDCVHNRKIGIDSFKSSNRILHLPNCRRNEVYSF